LINNILEAIQQNLLTTPSGSKKVSARADLLEAVEPIVGKMSRP
jgi:hypothetical protein